MSSFVDECLREWKRLGVPVGDSSEMAADLAADLAEAEAEGASPEEVLGNGVFDARSFAASWATARGVVPPRYRAAGRTRPRWTMVLAALVSFIAALTGLLIVGQRQAASVAVAMFRGPTAPFGPHAVRIGPHLAGPLIFPHGGPFLPVGLILLAAGLVGLGVTLWLWRPWSSLRGRPGFDEGVGLPSYL